MRSLSVREKVLIALAILVALLVGLPSLFANGTMREMVSTEAMRASILERQRKAERAIKLAEEAIAECEPLVRKLGWQEPPDALVPTLVQKLEQLAQESGVELSSYRPVKPKSLGAVTEVALEIHFTAPFPTTAKFIYALQRPETKVSVDVLRISSADSESDKVDVDVRICAYSLQSAPASATATVSRETRG
ncbi:MAG: type 4a pilus biogenesis protein PilO [Armatimonadota bacterium]